MMTEQQIANLDPGISTLVRLLQANGFKTTDSGDGKSKPPDERAIEFPHVFCVSTKDGLVKDCDLVLALLKQQGIDDFTVEGNYNPEDETPVIMILHKERPQA